MGAPKKLKKTIAHQENRDVTVKKQCKLQTTAEEFVKDYQSTSNSEQHSEVSMDSQQSEDCDFGF